MRIRVLIVLCFFAGLAPVHAQIAVDSLAFSLPLVKNEEVEVLRTDLETSFEGVQSQTGWLAYSPMDITSPESALWLKFEMVNRSSDTVHTYLYSLDHFTTIYQQGEEGYKKTENGLYVPLSRRPHKSDKNFTRISFAPLQKSQIYLRLNVHDLLPIPNVPTIYSESGYWKFSRDEYENQASSIVFIYFYLASLLTIIIFPAVFWLQLKNKLYLYYFGYLFFQLVYGFIVLRNTLAPIGNVFEYFPKLANDLIELAQFVFIGFYIFFISSLLRVSNYDKLLFRVLKYLGYACFIYALSHFVFSSFFNDLKVLALAFTSVRIIIFPINIILIVWIILKVKHPLLIYFIIGQSFFFISALLGSYIEYSGLNFIPGGLFSFKESPNIIFQVGLLAEVYCFSFALGENIFLLQKEKELANSELIAQLQENQLLQGSMNRELDEKVHEKTEELIKLYSKIESEKEQKIKDDFTQKIKATEMMALRSQMNPHFIFNSMSAIKHLIMTSRNDDAITYLDDFSTLLRGILQNSNRDKITVEEELEIVELYLSLEKNRMGTDFHYTIEVSSKEELSQYQIPPLLLQPLVENAIWHGLHPSLKSEKKLKVIFDTTDSLQIIIEDNGIGRRESAKKKKLHNSMGTSIVQDRLTLYNHLNDHSIYLKIIDLEEDDTTPGTRILLTYEY